MAELSENFWKWFGDSVTVDDNGDPLIFYHGTKQTFDTFKTKYDDKLVFFAYDEKFARDWGGQLTKEQEQLKDELDAGELRSFNNRLYKKYINKYGDRDNWNDSIEQSFNKLRKHYTNKQYTKVDIQTKVMPVYLKVHKIFVPQRDYELVLDKIAEYYEWPELDSKEFQDKLNATKKVYLDANASFIQYCNEHPDMDDDTYFSMEKEVDKKFADYRQYKSYVDTREYDLKRIKQGAWIYFEHGIVIDKVFDLGYDAIQLSEAGGIPTTLAVREGRNQIKSIFAKEFKNTNNIYEGIAMKNLLNETYTYSKNLTKAEEFGNKILIPSLKTLFDGEKGSYRPQMDNVKLEMLDSFMSITGFDLQPVSSGELIDANKNKFLKSKLNDYKNVLENKLQELGKQLEKELGFQCVDSVFADQYEAGIELGGKQLYENARTFIGKVRLINEESERLLNNYEFVTPDQKDAKFKIGDTINVGGKEGSIIVVKPLKLSATPCYKVGFKDGSTEWYYEEELNNLQESSIYERLDRTITDALAKNESLRGVRVHYKGEDGKEGSYETEINGTDEEINNYFAKGSTLNLGNGENDYMVNITNVEILDEAVDYVNEKELKALAKKILNGKDYPWRVLMGKMEKELNKQGKKFHTDDVQLAAKDMLRSVGGLA